MSCTCTDGWTGDTCNEGGCVVGVSSVTRAVKTGVLRVTLCAKMTSVGRQMPFVLHHVCQSNTFCEDGSILYYVTCFKLMRKVKAGV